MSEDRRAAEEIIPVIQEDIVIGRERAPTGTVHVRTVTLEDEHAIDEPVMITDVEVKRVPVDLWTDEPIADRIEGDTRIISVHREEIIVQRRLQTGGGRVRLHTSVEKRPIEEHVRLHEEEVHVERRSVDRPVSPEEAKKGLEERTVEVSATVERPVISKEARVVEEVAVGKTARDREEVVRDTVRRSRIEVEEDTRASDKVGS